MSKRKRSCGGVKSSPYYNLESDFFQVEKDLWEDFLLKVILLELKSTTDITVK